MRTSSVLIAITLLMLAFAAAAETPGQLWRDGYKIVWESGYETVEECTPDKGVVLSNEYIFVCDGYEYVYHYGAVSIASKSIGYQGKTLTVSYLCMEGEDECLSGTVYLKR